LLLFIVIIIILINIININEYLVLLFCIIKLIKQNHNI